jgi:hypothetical protein
MTGLLSGAVKMVKHLSRRYDYRRREALALLRRLAAEEAAIIAKYPDFAEPTESRPSRAAANKLLGVHDDEPAAPAEAQEPVQSAQAISRYQFH